MKLLSEKQKLARKRNWSLFLLRGAYATLGNARYTAFHDDPEHRGLLAIESAKSFIWKAIKEIRGETT